MVQGVCGPEEIVEGVLDEVARVDPTSSGVTRGKEVHEESVFLTACSSILMTDSLFFAGGLDGRRQAVILVVPCAA